MLNVDNAVLLVVDIQERLVNMLEKDTIVSKSCALGNAARILGVETIVSEQYPKGLGTTLDIVKNNLSANTKYFEKTSFNALDTEGIYEELKNTKNIFVFGIETHICVYQTVINLLEKNFNVFVIKDACASREKDEYKAGLNLMEKEGAKIITTEMVIFEMLKSSKHPNFKEVQVLIK